MSEAVTVKAPAKLTLNLRVMGVRADGYHFIDAEMISVDLFDELRVEAGSGLDVVEAGSGLTVPTGADNLITRALQLLGVSASVRVDKNIPAGAGLGGGSSDAAAILRWGGFTDEVAASALGADVAFCLVGGRARVSGIGELVEPLMHVPRRFTLLIPPFGVSTPEVYRRWDDLGGPSGTAGNDLEPAALALMPELVLWRDALGMATGVQPHLAGSGGTWFVEGAFDGVRYQGVKAINVQALSAHG